MAAFELWMVTAAANAVFVTVYAAIAFHILRGVHQGGQWRTNPIAVAMGAIFVSCTIGHGLHLEHTIVPALNGAPALSAAARTAFMDPRLLAWDVFTALVAAYYWTLRSRFPIMFKGAALFDDMRVREQQALDLHDNVVQGLARAKAALDLGRREEAAEALDTTLAAARGVITELMGRKGSPVALGPGDLRRKGPVQGGAP